MKKKMPTKKLIKELSELTDWNRHTECWMKIAEWCADNAEDTFDFAWFRAFYNMFEAMQRAHYFTGNNPYCSLRYEIGKEMEGLIVRVFGEKVLEAFNEGR